MNPSRPRRVLTIRGEAVPQVGLLEPLQLEGEEGINQLFEYRLILNTREPDIDLGALIGRELTCGLELDSPEAAEREISGLITQARYLGEAERHSRVELTLRPWLHLATLTTDCKVFQDQSPVEIIEAVLADYPFAADKRLIERYPRRDYTVQYNESDFEFLINTWIERPWEVRYFMQVKQPSSWEFLQQLAAKNNVRQKDIQQSWEILFNPTHIVRIPDWRTGNPDYPHDQAVVVIEFDSDGFATTPNNDNLRLRGRLNEIRRIVLSDEPSGKVYRLAHWFTGRDEDTPMEVVPALCRDAYEIPRVFTEKDDSYIYGNWFKPEAGDRLGFGCREWAYQLHSSDRPYIDVTTYGPKNKRYPHGTYINDFIGWSTFDARKPVVGKHADTWYCLYECPNGDSPGKIESIGQWAARNGWNPPRPPTRVPTFTDDPRRRGAYVN